MIEFAEWIRDAGPNVGMAIWLALTAYVSYCYYAWKRALRRMND